MEKLWTPVTRTVRRPKWKLDVVRLILENGATVDPRTDDGWTSLMLASHSGHLDVVRSLLENGATVDTREDNGRISLTLASNKGQEIG